MRAFTVRYKVWHILAAVVVVALSLGYLRRPYPAQTTMVLTDATPSMSSLEITTHWSDGRVRRIAAQCPRGGVLPRDLKASEPSIVGRHVGPLLRLERSDGSTTYYLEGR
jgi:hypothetical protein